MVGTQKFKSIVEHSAMREYKQISSICKPLLTLNSNYFYFQKIFPDGTSTALSTECDWYQHTFENIYKTFDSNYKINDFDEPSQYFCTDQSSDPLLTLAKDYFGLKEIVSIMRPYKQHVEIYYFGRTDSCKTKNKNSILLNTWLNNMDLFDKFILYFKDKAEKIIAKADNNRIQLPCQTVKHYHEINCRHNLFNKKIHRELTVENYHTVNQDDMPVMITQRQQQCLQWLALGKTVEEIAIIMEISHHTVQRHLENLRVKLNCHKQSSMVLRAVKLKIIPEII